MVFFYCFLSISRLSRQSICVQNEYVHIIVIITKHKANIYLFFWSFVRSFFVAYCLVRSRITFTIIWWTCCADGRFGILLSCSLMWNHRTLKCVHRTVCIHNILCEKMHYVSQCRQMPSSFTFHSFAQHWSTMKYSIERINEERKETSRIKKKNTRCKTIHIIIPYMKHTFSVHLINMSLFLYMCLGDISRRCLSPIDISGRHSRMPMCYILLIYWYCNNNIFVFSNKWYG